VIVASEFPVAHRFCVRMLRVCDELLLDFPSLPDTPVAGRNRGRLQMDFCGTACRLCPGGGHTSIPRYPVVGLVVWRRLRSG
ncbi:hypothetical protein, partial [Roseiconus lacunae]